MSGRRRRRRPSNVDGTLRSKASSKEEIKAIEQQKEEIEAIEQQKEEIKAIEQLLNSSSTDDIVFEGFMPDDLLSVESNLRFVSSFSQIEFESLERSLSQIPCTSVESKLVSLESSSSQIEFERSQIPWPTDFSDPDLSLPWVPLPSRPLHPNPYGLYDLPFDYQCEICGANHWTDTCSYLREISLDDAKRINDSEFDIVCFNCWKVIDNGACPFRCSPAGFKVSRKAVFHLPGYAPTDLLSKDPLTAQQVPTSFSRKQKEASVSTETPNTIEDLSAPQGSNSSSQERKTYPLASYDLEA